MQDFHRRRIGPLAVFPRDGERQDFLNHGTQAFRGRVLLDPDRSHDAET